VPAGEFVDQKLRLRLAQLNAQVWIAPLQDRQHFRQQIGARDGMTPSLHRPVSGRPRWRAKSTRSPSAARSLPASIATHHDDSRGSGLIRIAFKPSIRILYAMMT